MKELKLFVPDKMMCGTVTAVTRVGIDDFVQFCATFNSNDECVYVDEDDEPSEDAT